MKGKGYCKVPFIGLLVFGVLILAISALGSSEIDIAQGVFIDDDDNQLNDPEFYAYEKEESKEGINIKVYDEHGSKVDDDATDENGEAKFSDYENGKYSWKAFLDESEIDSGTFDVAIGEREVQGASLITGRSNVDYNEVVLFAFNHYSNDENQNGEENVKIEIYEGTTLYASGYSDYEGYFWVSELETGWFDFNILYNDEIFNTGKFYSYGPDPDADSVLSGQITDEDSEEPVPQTMLNFYMDEKKDDDYVEYTTYTDEEGNYRIEMQSGDYRYGVSHRKYYALYDEITINSGEQFMDLELDKKSKLYGFVKDSDSNEPIANAEVEAESEWDYDWDWTYSKPDGYYELWLGPETYNIWATHDDYEDYEDKGVELKEDEEKEYNILMDPKPPKDAKVYGEITDKDSGDPVRDAYVELYDEENEEQFDDHTDSDGNYEIECYGDRDYDYSVYHEDYDEYEEQISVKKDEQKEKNVELEKKPLLYGYVTDSSNGDPIDDVEIELQGKEKNWYWVYTDENGYYEQTVEKDTYDLKATHEDYYDYEGQVTVEEDTEYSFQMNPKSAKNSRVYGDVTNKKTGDEIADVYVRIYNEDDSFDGYTDDSGYYSIDVRSGSYTIEFNHDDYKPYSDEITVTESEEKEYDAELEPKVKVYGHVYDNDTKEAIEGVYLSIYSDEDNEDFDRDDSDSEGYYELHVDGDKEYSISAYHDDYKDYYDIITVGSEDYEYDIYMEPKGAEDSKIYGTVTDNETGKPIEKAEINLYNKEDRYNTTTDTDGYYEIKCRAGEYDIEVRKDNYKSHYGQVIVGENEEKRYDVELEPGGSGETYLEGYVTEGSSDKGEGDPIENADIMLIGENEYKTQTDHNGYFYIECNEGEYTIEIKHVDYEDYSDKIYVEEGGNEYEAELTPKDVKTYLEGNVIDADTEGAIQDATVKLEGTSYEETTGKSGYYYFECPAGDYSIIITHDDYEDYSDDIEIETGKNVHDAELTPKSVLTYVEGTVEDIVTEDGIKNAIVKLDGTSYEDTTSSSGYYNIECDPGDYTIIITHDDYEEHSEEITVAEGKNENNVELKKKIRVTEKEEFDLGNGQKVEYFAGIEGDGEINVEKVSNPSGDDRGTIDIFIDFTFEGDGTLLWLNMSIFYNNLPMGVNAENLKIYYWDGSDWVESENTNVNTDDKIIYANVTHLTVFAPIDMDAIEYFKFSGYVKDKDDNIMEGVDVLLWLGTDTEIPIGFDETDSNGYYNLTTIESGEYWFVVVIENYNSFIDKITIDTDTTLDVKLDLKLTDSGEIEYRFDDWNVGEMTVNITFSESNLTRFFWDSDNNGVIDDSDETAIKQELEENIKNELEENFSVDDIFYEFNIEEIELTNFKSNILNENPLSLNIKFELTSKSNVPDSNSHEIQVKIEYDGIENTIILPENYEYVSDDSPNDISISGVEIITIEPESNDNDGVNVTITVKKKEDTIYGVELTGDSNKEVKIGENTEFDILVKNMGNVDANIIFEISGDKKIWGSLSKSSSIINADKNETIKVTFDVPIDADEGNFIIKFIAYPENDSSNIEEWEMTLEVSKEVTEEYDIKLSTTVTKKESKAGKTITLDFTVENIGTSNDTIILSLSGEKSDWGKLNIENIELESGASETITLTVEIPKDTKKGDYIIDITVTSMNNPQVTETSTITVSVTESSEKDDSSFPIIIPVGMAIAAVGVIGFVIFLKKREDYEYEDDEEDYEDDDD